VPARDRNAFIRKTNTLIKQAEELDKETIRKTLHFSKMVRRDVRNAIATAEAWDAAYLPRLKDELTARIRRFRSELQGLTSEQMGKSWELGRRLADEPLEAAKIMTALPVLSDELLTITQGYAADLILDLERDMFNKISVRLNNAILGKETQWQAMKKIDKEVFKVKEKKGVTWRTERIVRTEVNRVYSMANQARMNQAKEQVPDLMKRWVTARDERVRGLGAPRKTPRRSPISGEVIDHRAAHEQVRKVDEPFLVSGEELLFPRDPIGSSENVVGCRCSSVPFLGRFVE